MPAVGASPDPAVVVGDGQYPDGCLFRGGTVSTVRSSRRIERAGVNALRTLLEEHDHIVQEIDGGNDHSEDMIINFTRGGKRTGYWIAIQVKSGKKYKRANGYAIPVEDHFKDWRQSRIPIVGVVYDMKKKELFWVNLTEQLRLTEESPSWVQVPNSARLHTESMHDFFLKISTYAGDARMRIRSESEEEAFAEAVRARQGLDPETAPNPYMKALPTSPSATRIEFAPSRKTGCAPSPCKS
ncbi:DUF4365 domain-containing protein [Streptomyces sp. NBC_01276]|uniref:DUF4365 domain-containing protein n=1 Tax=Streptomyces sp. NBC_01276 TaxID=2903808 RepID=UPI00352D574C